MDEESAYKVMQSLSNRKVDFWIGLSGISMEPAFYGVTRLHIVPDESYRYGDVVLVHNPEGGEAFAHRIVGVDKKNQAMPYIIKGDNSYVYDNKTAQIVRQDILGRVEQAERDDGSTVEKIRSRLIARISYWEGKINLSSYKTMRHDRIMRRHTFYLRILCAVVGKKKGGLTQVCGRD